MVWRMLEESPHLTSPVLRTKCRTFCQSLWAPRRRCQTTADRIRHYMMLVSLFPNLNALEQIVLLFQWVLDKRSFSQKKLIPLKSQIGELFQWRLLLSSLQRNYLTILNKSSKFRIRRIAACIAKMYWFIAFRSYLVSSLSLCQCVFCTYCENAKRRTKAAAIKRNPDE